MAQAPPAQGMHSLSTIIKRLEAVTSRLEDVATTQQASGHGSMRSPTGAAHDSLASTVGAGAAGAAGGAAAGAAASGAPPPPPPPPPPVAAEELTPAVKAYDDEIISGPLREFEANAKKVGGIAEQASAFVSPLVEAQFAFLKMASGHAKPSQSAMPNLLKPQADAIGAIMEAKDKLGRSKDGREWGAALSVIGEGAGAFGWVQVEPAPAPFVAEMKNSSQFWIDRVNKQFKETKPEAVEWARSYGALLDALQKYVKQWHTTGVAWDPKGPAAPSSVPSSNDAPAAGGAPGGAPPPPPPPPPAGGAATKSSGGGGHAALLADLNKGSDITSGLKKVDSSQMTHKNPGLRTTGTVPENNSSPGKKGPPPTKPKPASFSKAPAKKPARTELEDGNKWIVENHEDNKSIVIEGVALHHTVHVFGCTNSVVRIVGKLNAVSMVNCKKTSLVVDTLVSSLSVTSSPSFEVQIVGSVPTVLVDSTDSGQVYLSKECMNTIEIITAKTSALNVSVPTGDDGDYVERPVPEQMKSRVVDGKLVTEIVEHAG